MTKLKRYPLKQKIEWLEKHKHLWHDLPKLAEKAEAEGIYAATNSRCGARSGLHAFLMRYFKVDSRKLNGTEIQT